MHALPIRRFLHTTSIPLPDYFPRKGLLSKACRRDTTPYKVRENGWDHFDINGSLVHGGGDHLEKAANDAKEAAVELKVGVKGDVVGIRVGSYQIQTILVLRGLFPLRYTPL